METENSEEIRPLARVTCGKCLGSFPNNDNFRQHAITHHNGLARPSGENQDFTEEEKQTALKAAFRTLKKLRCQKPNCGKVFISLGGYAYHEKQCGQEGLYNDCPICGKRLKELSLKYHMKMSHPPSPPPVKDEDSLRVTFQQKEQPKRKAAKRAREKVLEITRGLDRDDIMSSKDYSSFNHSDKSPTETTEAPVISYTRPPVIHISTSLYAEWRAELEKTGKITCKNEGCTESYSAPWQMRTHYVACPNNPLVQNYTCNLCGKKTKTEGSMLTHVDSHNNDLTNNYASDDDCEEEVDGEGRPNELTGFGGFFNPYSWSGPDLEPFALAVDWTQEFMKKNFQEALYLKWRPIRKDWTALSEKDYTGYLPVNKTSIAFKTSIISSPDKPTPDWTTADLFESTSSDEECGSTTFFVGGPVWACSWCPTPINKVAGQFLAISCHLDMEIESKTIDACNGPGLIQIWEVTETKQPKYSLSSHFCFGIAHDFGYIWEFEWCPSGCWDDPSQNKEETLASLGLLAAACSNGTIVIFSIPQPASVMKDQTKPLIFKVNPVVILDTCASFSSGDKNRIPFQCLSLNWLKSKGHKLIAGGFADGHIACWDLETKSPLLYQFTENKDIFSPYLIHHAHSSSVHSLAWSHLHNGLFLATAGMDRQICIWCCNDLSVPYNSNSRGRIIKVKWCAHWCGVFACHDDCYNLGRNYTSFMESGYFGYCQRALIGHNGCIWDLALNEWMNCCVSCDSSGEVVGSVLSQLLDNISNIKYMSKRRFPIYRCIVNELNPIEDNDEGNKENDNENHLVSEKGNDQECAVKTENSEIWPSSQGILTNSISGDETSLEMKLNDIPKITSAEDTAHAESPVHKIIVEPDVSLIEAVSTTITEEPKNSPAGCEEDKSSIADIPSKNAASEENTINKNSKCTTKLGLSSNSKIKLHSEYVTKPRTYKEISSQHGVHFYDANLSTRIILKEEHNRLMVPGNMTHVPPDIYPLTSVNRVAWNPNVGHEVILASGCQSGLVRIHRVHWLHKPNLDRLKANLQSAGSDSSPESPPSREVKEEAMEVTEEPDVQVQTQTRIETNQDSEQTLDLEIIKNASTECETMNIELGSHLLDSESRNESNSSNQFVQVKER